MSEPEMITETEERTTRLQQIKLFPIDGATNTAEEQANSFAIQIFAETGNYPTIEQNGNYISVVYWKLCKYQKEIKTPKIG
jgi:hypothetical protein